MVTAGEDGSVKIWNFSNGHSLKNLVTEENDATKGAVVSKRPQPQVGTGEESKEKSKKRKRYEYTELIAVHDEDKMEKMAHFVAVGWDRRLHIWDDDRESDAENVKEHQNKSDPGIDGHRDDIMSACYDVKTNLVFTGGHDGTLLGWHFETGFVKYHFHEIDKTCVS